MADCIEEIFGAGIKKWVPALIVFSITVYSFFVQLGYSVLTSDQLIYFPSIFRSLHPGMLGRDFAASFSPGDFTLFGRTILLATHIFGQDIYIAVFFLTVLARFVFFYSLYLTVRYFTNNNIFSLSALLLCIIGFKIYGSGMRTFAPMLLARDISTAFSLLSLVFLFSGRRVLSSIALGVGLAMNVSMAAAFAVIFYLSLLWEKEKWSRIWTWLAALIPFGFILILWSLVPHSSAAGLFGVIDPHWKDILLRRESYVFVTTWYWPNNAIIFIAASIYFFILTFKELFNALGDAGKKRYFIIAFFVPLFLTIAAIAGEILNVALVMSLQLARGLILWKLVFNMLFAYYAYLYLRDHRADVLYNFSLVGIVLSFMISEKVMLLFLPLQAFVWIGRRLGAAYPRLAFFRNPYAALFVFFLTVPPLIFVAFLHETGAFLEFVPAIAIAALALALSVRYVRAIDIFGLLHPAPVLAFILITVLLNIGGVAIRPGELSNAKFMEMCDWVSRHTAADEVFVTEPFSGVAGPLRMICLRNVFVTKKDGGAAMFNKEFAYEWDKRKTLAYDAPTNQAAREQIIKEYGVGYLIADNKLSFDYPLAFDNSRYFVYKLK